MKLTFSFTIVSLSLVALSCTKSATPAKTPVGSTSAEPAPPPPPAAGGTAYTIDEACTTSVAATSRLGSIAESNKDDCDRMGAAYEKFAVDYKNYFDWAKTALNDPPTKQAYLEKCMEPVKKVMETVGPQMKMLDSCSSNARVTNALKAMQ